ncbi:MAG TPA: COX15/CtaA family protein [Dehalococcoidia bacterium]|nr:COX15/CtaA family protein [Dehalococcoidia bacterium]
MATMKAQAIERAYRWVVFLALVSTCLLIVVGAVVRVSGSGLGCAEWPSCEGGSVVPPLRADALIEMSHRASASVVSLFVAATFFGALIWYRHRPVVLGLAIAVTALLAVQIALGAVTVLLELPEDVVTLHLGTAEAILGGLVLLNLAFVRPRGAVAIQDVPWYRRDRVFWLGVATAAAIFLVVLSGAYVRGHGAASACGADWPLCQGSALPWSELTAVHLGHRYLVLLVSGLLGWTVIEARRRGHLPAVGHAAATLAGLYVLQILVGAATPWTHLAPAARAAHLAVATLVWGAAVAFAAVSWWLAPATVGQHDATEAETRLGTSARALPDAPGS